MIRLDEYEPIKLMDDRTKTLVDPDREERILLKASSLFEWLVRSLKHNHIKNRYSLGSLVIQGFSLTGK